MVLFLDSMIVVLKLFIFIYGLLLLVAGAVDEELYKLLGVSKTATTREIRQAFKKIALVKHPDKNTVSGIWKTNVNIYFYGLFKHDPNANENFIKINRAYEILKDDDLRKKYDLYGEKGLHDANNQGFSQYQSWNFYQQNFGIYDEDPEIITLSRSDFCMYFWLKSFFLI